MSDNKPLVVCGLDGVLALLEHRLHYLYNEEGPRDWEGFHAACGEDMPNFKLIDRLNQARGEGAQIILISARSSAVREQTLRWLSDWQIGYDALWLRPPRDFRPTEEYKAEILTRHYPGVAVRRVYESTRQLGMARWCRQQDIPCTLIGHNQGNGESREQLELMVLPHPCGHTMLHPFYGDDDYGWAERARQIATGPCALCHADEQLRERQQQAEQARLQAAQRGLPPLEGSDRQVAWAEGVRLGAFGAIDKVLRWVEQVEAQAMAEDPDYWQGVKQGMQRAILWLEAQTDAKWWIDHRHGMANSLDSGRAMLSAIATELGYL
jgi:hypothetical protein